MILNNEEMMNVSGGGVFVKILAGVGAALLFGIGVVTGFINPNRCNK